MINKGVSLEDVSFKYLNIKEAVDHAIDLLDSMLKKPRFVISKKDSKIYFLLRRDLPYVIHGTTLEKIKIVLNRDYKPLGQPVGSDESIVYENCFNMHINIQVGKIFPITHFNGNEYLFDDGNPPWRNREHATAYLERLKMLSAAL